MCFKYFFLLCFLVAYPLAAMDMSPTFVQSCLVKLQANAMTAEAVNADIMPLYIRSKAYADFDKAPEDFWSLSQKDPKTFNLAVAERLELLGDFAVRYTRILSTLDPQNISQEQANEIVALEANPLFNMLLDETEAIPDFEATTFHDLNQKAQKNYLKATAELKITTAKVLELRNKLKALISPSTLSLKSAKR